MTTSHELNVQPTLRFLFTHPAHLLSFGFGSGLAPRMPGTFGTLVAFPLFWLANRYLNEGAFLIMLIWAYAFGILACEKTGKVLGDADYGGIVWDEIVAFMLVLFFTPPGIVWWLLAFSLFRFFDIVKPPPIRHFDSHWHGGHGVMFDDILAAGYTLLCLALIKSVLV